MKKQTKDKNIIIKEDTEINDNNKGLNKIVLKEKSICCCGKIGTKDCIFGACKNCCKNEYCKKHSQQLKELIINSCVFCNANTKLKCGNIYFCKSCYKTNTKLIDNILPKKYMFETGNSEKCSCGLIAPTSCIFNSCRNCCPSKFCQRHNKDINSLGQYNCSICSKIYNINSMNSFYVNSIDKITHYCKKCYENNRIFINNLIFKNAKEEEIKKFRIKVIETPEEILKKNKMKELQEKQQKDYEEFKMKLEKYKEEILTDKKIKNIEKNENFCLGELMEQDIKYKCPICKKINKFEDTNSCINCDRFICLSNCCEIKMKECPYTNCYHCSKGYCNNNITHYYCKDCFVDYNKEIYEKYKGKPVSNEILEEEIFDLDDFSKSKYELEFLCHLCEDYYKLNNSLISLCDRCENYVCKDCGISRYATCGVPNCIYCINKSCYNGEHYFFCKQCAYEMLGLESSEEEDEEKEIKVKNRCSSPVELASNKTEECNICFMNKKNYACVPCGHLCMCGDCANKVDTKCPMCNAEFTNIIKIFG
jgi:hypothetical protein